MVIHGCTEVSISLVMSLANSIVFCDEAAMDSLKFYKLKSGLLEMNSRKLFYVKSGLLDSRKIF